LLYYVVIIDSSEIRTMATDGRVLYAVFAITFLYC